MNKLSFNNLYMCSVHIVVDDLHGKRIEERMYQAIAKQGDWFLYKPISTEWAIAHKESGQCITSGEFNKNDSMNILRELPAEFSLPILDYSSIAKYHKSLRLSVVEKSEEWLPIISILDSWAKRRGKEQLIDKMKEIGMLS